jgi:multidrug resistance efflux pump
MKHTEWLAEGLSSRAASLAVFGLSVAALVGLGWLRQHSASPLPAVAQAPSWEVAARPQERVLEVFVRPGELVQAGAPLLRVEDQALRWELESLERAIDEERARAALELASLRLALEERAWERELARSEAQGELTTRRALVSRARAGVEAATRRRDEIAAWVAQGVEPRAALAEAQQDLEERAAVLREAEALARDGERHLGATAPGSPPAALAPQEALGGAALARMERRRAQLREALEAATLRAPAAAQVAESPWPGQLGGRVRLVDARAIEVVAWYAPTTSPAALPLPGQEALLGTACEGQRVRVLRRGAGVEAAPLQVGSLRLGEALYGVPVYFTSPPDCALVDGQVLTVQVTP